MDRNDVRLTYAGPTHAGVTHTPAGSGRGVPLQGDPAAERPRLQEPQPGDLVTVGEETAATALDGRVDEEAVLVDQSGRDQRVGQGDAAGEDDVLAALLGLGKRTSSTGSPFSTVEFCQPGSVTVPETTYLATRSR